MNNYDALSFKPKNLFLNNNVADKTLIVVVGPTAVGKTETCLTLAQHYHTAIVSADSRQFYKEMNLGTAKPTSEELSLVPHYLVNQLSVHQRYTVKDFETDALKAIGAIHAQKDIAILAGGSGLFVKAVCEGLDEMPDIPSHYRENIMEELQNEGLPSLVTQLKNLDPLYYDLVDKANVQRVVRALEVISFTGKPYSAFRKNKKAVRPFNIVKIGLLRNREILYDRINARMEKMIAAGLFEEARELFPFRELNALQTVGYSEIFDYLEGKYDYEEAVRLLKRNSRRYAKRQLTWFKKDGEVAWFDPEETAFLIRQIDQKL